MPTKSATHHRIPPSTRKLGKGAPSRSPKQAAAPFAWVDRLIAAQPEATWDAIPNDSSTNLDHYLYGAPKHKR